LSGCADDTVAVTIRPERKGDEAGIRAVHAAAFGREAEAVLVDRLRNEELGIVSLIAEGRGEILGHIVFSPVHVESREQPGERDLSLGLALGLGPVAVLPEYQNKGIGRELIHSGLEASRDLGADFAVVLGHPSYYPRFGFRRARDLNIENEFGADEAFMASELWPGRLPRSGVLVRYAAPFLDVDEQVDHAAVVVDGCKRW
jgi:putative acetyltransferase